MRKHPKDLEISALPPHVREEVETWQRLLQHALNCRPVRSVLQTIASSREVSLATAYRQLRAYENYGWRGLVNRAKLPTSPPAPPHTFRAFLHGLWIVNKRSYRVTHQQVVAMWKGGAEIPGYAKRPKARSLAGCPDGWTYENFIYLIKTFEDHAVNESRPSPASRAVQS